MALTPTLKISSENWDSTFGTPYVTSAFTPSDNSLLVVSIAVLTTTAGAITWAVSSSPSLTWTKRVGIDSGTSNASQTDIWTAPVTTGASTTVTIAPDAAHAPQADGAMHMTGLTIVEYLGYDSVSPIGATGTSMLGSSRTGALSYSLSGTTASDSEVYSLVSIDGDPFDSAPTVGSGYTERYSSASGTNDWYHSLFEYKVGALTTADYSDVTPVYSYASAAIEIKAAPAGLTHTIYETTATGATRTTSVSGSITVAVGDLIIVALSTPNGGTGARPALNASAMSKSGTAITWTYKSQVGDGDTGTCAVYLWSGESTAAETCTFTVTHASTNEPAIVRVFVYQGHNATTPVPAGKIVTDAINGTSVSLSITPTNALGSELWLISGDWDATNTFAAGANCSLEGTPYHNASYMTEALIRPTTQPRPDGSAFTLACSVTAGSAIGLAFEVVSAGTVVPFIAKNKLTLQAAKRASYY